MKRICEQIDQPSSVKAIIATARSYGGGSMVAYEQGKRLLQVLDISPRQYNEAIRQLIKAARI